MIIRMKMKIIKKKVLVIQILVMRMKKMEVIMM